MGINILLNKKEGVIAPSFYMCIKGIRVNTAALDVYNKTKKLKPQKYL